MRWLGVALAARLTFVGLPLFPRVAATLAGVIIGPALIAIIGYALFASCTPEYLFPRDESGVLFGAVFLVLLSTVVRIMGALWPNHQVRVGEVVDKRFPLFHAIRGGANTVRAAALGAVAGLTC